MKTSIIQLDSHDDVLSIKDKVAWCKSSRILLVWPRKSLALQQIDLVLIQRACQQQGAQLAIVTDERDVINLAQELGVSVFESLSRAQRLSWRRPRGKKALLRRTPLMNLPEKPENRSQSTWQNNRSVRRGAVVMAAIAVLFLIIIFIPSANVELFPTKETQTIILEVKPSPNLISVNFSGGVPVTIHSVIVEGEDSRISSGSMTVPVSFSTGRVVFTNLTEQEVLIPQGSFVASSLNPSIRFQTIATVQLPGKVNSKIDVRVQAVQPGGTGNVTAGDIQSVDGLLGSKVSVTNLDSTTGGDDRVSATPSNTDYEVLKERLILQLRTAASAELKRKIGDDHLLEKSVSLKRIIHEIRDPENTSPSDTLKILIRAEYQAWVIRSIDLRELAQRSLDAALPEKKRALDETLSVIHLDNGSMDFEGGTWRVEISREIEDMLDKQAIANLVRGMTVSNAISHLERSYNFLRSPGIDLNPIWWPTLPFLTFQIKISP